MTTSCDESRDPTRTTPVVCEPGVVSATILDHYRRLGGKRYDEVVTQTQHALQCAALWSAREHRNRSWLQPCCTTSVT